MLGRQTYQIAVPCRLKPVELHRVASPFEGSIARVMVERGDEVVAGDVLLEMNTEPLQSERQKLVAEHDLARLDMMRALQEGKQATAMQAQARQRMAEARLAAIDMELQQAVVRARADGVVMTGDLKPRVGEIVPLGEPLLEIAPNGKFSIELLAGEQHAMHLSPGQSGQFAMNARPDEVFACSLDRLSPASVVVNGQNVFIAKCSPQTTTPGWLRAGMEGVARVDAGQKPVWWVWLHRTLDAFRIQLWKL
jgi:multidrug resistance efflux pump